MKKFLRPLAIALTVITAVNVSAQNKNITLLGRQQYTNSTLYGDLNDVWGYVDTASNEYAIVGLQKGVSIVDVTDPQNMSEVFFIAGASSIWRDIKTWNKHAYITNETTGGLMIIDMSKLPGQILSSDVYSFNGSNYAFNKAHNLYIDENGVAYVFGANYSKKGAIMLDLTTNPKVPQEVGIFDSLYLHDGMARGDTLWGSAVYAGVLVAVDVSNKSNPTIIGSQFTADFFTHNCWVSNNGKYVFTTDEKSGAYVGSYDVSDISNIRNMDNIQSNPGSGVIPHNTHVYGDFLVTSYYRDGVTIVDATHPEKMVEVGNYDTSPLLSGSGFNGSWGAYPWLPSGNLLATDIENGLYVLGADYIKGVYVEGTIRKFSDSSKVPSALVRCITTGDSLIAGLNGAYEFAFADSGVYQFTFEKAGFLTDTLDVFLHSGQLFIGDVYLRDETPLKIGGRIHDVSSGNPIVNAKIYLESDHFIYNAQTDVNGYFEVDSMYEGSYDVTSGKWGHVNGCQTYIIQSSTDSIKMDLEKGIYDDFTLNFGWAVITGGTKGGWERQKLEKDLAFSTLDYPQVDVGSDCSNFAMITGNSTKNNHDVDGGPNSVTSPKIDASGFSRPVIEYSFWFRNDAPTGQDDTLIVTIFDPFQNRVVSKIHNLTNTTQSQWIQERIEMRNYNIDYENALFQVQFSIGDFGNDDLLEAGIDYFTVTEGANAIEEIGTAGSVKLYPNPTSNVLNFSLPEGFVAKDYVVFDVTGKSILRSTLNQNVSNIVLSDQIEKGLNLIQFIDANGKSVTGRFIRN